MLTKKLFFLLFIIVYCNTVSLSQPITDDQILSYTVNPKTQDLRLFWKDDKGEILKSLHALKKFVSGKSLLLQFAMNGGMYTKDHSPQGLFILSQKTLSPLDTHSGGGNFYLQPNGVFYITLDKTPVVCKTSDFKSMQKSNMLPSRGPCY